MRIFIENGPIELPVNPAVSILNTLLRNGVRIAHKCGGKAICGTCRIRVLDGANRLSPRTEPETARLDAMGNPPDTRLACQTYAAGDIRIKVPSLRRAHP